MAGSSRYTAVLDANVLYPNLLRDILLSLAAAGLYHARWTTHINDEWTRNLVANRPDIESKIGLLLEQVNAAVPDCLVGNYEYLIDCLSLPDADAIVTANLKDFPAKVMAQHGIEVQHPDDFIMNQLELRPFEALEVLKRVRAKRRNPACSASEFIDMVERSGLPQTAQHLRVRAGLI